MDVFSIFKLPYKYHSKIRAESVNFPSILFGGKFFEGVDGERWFPVVTINGNSIWKIDGIDEIYIA